MNSVNFNKVHEVSHERGRWPQAPSQIEEKNLLDPYAPLLIVGAVFNRELLGIAYTNK